MEGELNGGCPSIISSASTLNVAEPISDDQELFLKVLENLKNAVNVKPDYSVALPKQQKPPQNNHDTAGPSVGNDNLEILMNQDPHNTVTLSKFAKGHQDTDKPIAGDKDLNQETLKISNVVVPRSESEEPGTTCVTVSDKTKSLILQKIIVSNELEKIKSSCKSMELTPERDTGADNVSNLNKPKESQNISKDNVQENPANNVTVTVVGIDKSKNHITEKKTSVFNSNIVEYLAKPSDKIKVTPASIVQRTLVPNPPAIQLFTCSMCDYYSENKNYLKQHLDLVHNNERPYKCPYCEYAGKRSHALREHLIVHSNERPFQCKSCNATFRKKGHLTNHIKLHNSRRLVKCPLCKTLIYDTGDNGLDAHLKNEHDTERLYGCDLCDHVAANEPQILEHLRNMHKSKLVAYKCDQCPFQTSNTVDFNAHMDAHTMANTSVQVGSSTPGKVVAIATLPLEETLTDVSKTSVKIGNVDDVPSQAAVIKPVWIKCSECGFTAQDSEVIKKHMLEHLGMEVLKDPKQHIQQILTPLNTSLKHNSQHRSSVSGQAPPVLVPVTNVENLFPQHSGKLDLNSPILVPVSDPAMLKSLQSMSMSNILRTTSSGLIQIDSSMFTGSTGSSNIPEQAFRSMSGTVSAGMVNHDNVTVSNKPVLASSSSLVKSSLSSFGLTTSPSLSSPSLSASSKQTVIPLQKHQMEQLMKNPNFKVIPVNDPQSISHIANKCSGVKPGTVAASNTPRSSECKGISISHPMVVPQGQTVHTGMTLPTSTQQTGGFKLTQIPVPSVKQLKQPQEISFSSPVFKEDMTEGVVTKEKVNQEDKKVAVLQESLANIQQLIEDQNKLNKKIGLPVSNLDSKGFPEQPSKQKVVYYLSRVENQNTAKNVKNAGFTHDSSAGRFKCTLCGYTCEYQRTIKAHVWKHSGNKNIDYPMFQNGPLSIYDEGHYVHTEMDEINEESQEKHTEDDIQEVVVGSVAEPIPSVIANSSTESKTGQVAGSKLPSFIVYDQTRISNVAPALANLLAARTMANMAKTKKSSESDCQGNDAQGFNAVQEESVSQNEREPQLFKGKELYEINAVSSGKNKIPVSFTNTGNVIEDRDDSHRIHIFDTSQAESSSSEGSKSPVPKQTSANVVVEAVNSVNTTLGYTGLHSQQSSPRVTPAPKSPDSGVSELTMTSRTMDDSSSSGLVSPIPYREQLQETEGMQTRLGKRKVVEHAAEDGHKMPGSLAKKSKSDSLEDSAVTLLSLLKKGPNFNPACPPKSGNVSFAGEQVNIPSPVQDDSNSMGESDAKPKSGISTSLLAVIEQLRERSKSDQDEEKPLISVPSKKASKRRSRRSSMEENESAAGIENVEQFEVEGQVKFRCKLCHYTNESTLLLKQHMRLHKPKQEFECSLCDLIAESSEALQDHMIQHCKVRTYQCKLCNSAFNYKSQLRAHMRMHNDQDILLCDFCDFESRSAAALKTHIKSHLTKPPYKCDVCKEEFITSFNLRIHKREGCYTSIDKLGHFKCDECDFTSFGRREMKNHQKIHLGKNVVHQQKGCPYCDYIGSNVDQIQQHIADVHGESKPLKCEMCGFVAVSIRSLKSHMKRHVNDQRYVAQPLEQYKCNLCGYVCHHLPSLKSHMWRHAADQHYSYEFTNDVINAAIDFDSRIDAVDTTQDHVNNFRKLIFDKMKAKGLESTRSTQEESAAACCWVTFRCCQCGFETINKAELNMHMTDHSDVIKWTLDVSEEDRKQDDGPLVIQEQVVPYVETNKAVPQIMNV